MLYIVYILDKSISSQIISELISDLILILKCFGLILILENAYPSINNIYLDLLQLILFNCNVHLHGDTDLLIHILYRTLKPKLLKLTDNILHLYV